MGKRITQQARGRGGPAFKVRKSAYRHKISYPPLSYSGSGKIIRLINSAGHSAPLAKVEIVVEKKGKKVKKEKIYFIVPAAEGVYEGQEIYIGKRPENAKAEVGDILNLKDIVQGTKVFNIESVPGKGGKILRSSGSSCIVMTNEKDKVEILIRRKRIKLNENGRAVVGVVSGDGRKMKPLVKAGKTHYIMKAKGRKWHRTSAIKVNAIDHPFGGGRGKRIKSKIAKRNSPPGLKVGHIRPKKTGRKK